MTDQFNPVEFNPTASEETMEICCKSHDILPMLPLRDMTLFPHVTIPVSVGRKKSLRLVRDVHKEKAELFVCSQRDAAVEDPSFADMHTIGVIATINKIIELPDGNTAVFLEGKARARLLSIKSSHPYLTAEIDIIEDQATEKENNVIKAMKGALLDSATKIINLSENIPNEAVGILSNIQNAETFINFICANFELDPEIRQNLLNEDLVFERGYLLLDTLSEVEKILEIKHDIKRKAKLEIDRQQREYLLQQEARAIQDELGGAEEDDIISLQSKADAKLWPEAVRQTFDRELLKLQRINPSAPDYAVQYNYLETLVNLPWNEFTTDVFDLTRAQKILDKDHFGMEKIKERIIEYLAVLKLKGDLKSPIICLHGAPGVGKTSLGKSIAEALGRKYVRMSLGGVHDEAEIRGHRRTYIGAMPGRIIQGLNKCQSSNPVFVLDEIDKVSKDIKGDPESALLEVLDPEQNTTFHDNFLDVDYDLSNVLFIATANDVSSIARPLLDRMELIEVPGYISAEKEEIAMKHLIPKQCSEHGIPKRQIKISRPTIAEIINNYTRESGVRTLERKIAKIMRKTASMIVEDSSVIVKVTPSNLTSFLGPTEIDHEKYDTDNCAGVVTGLAWTQVGGEILQIETSINTQKGSTLTMTGNLGNVMKESAQLAMEYIKANCDRMGISAETIEKHCVHIHVPEGATPKDGPSAGIAILTSLVSAFKNKPIREHLAMTGEITLRGKVLAVGGIREKVLAAKRAGITDIILCKSNKKDIDEIPEKYLEGLTFHYVAKMDEVLDIAFS